MQEVSLINGHTEGTEICVMCGRVIPEGRQVCALCKFKILDCEGE